MVAKANFDVEVFRQRDQTARQVAGERLAKEAAYFDGRAESRPGPVKMQV